MVNRETNFNRKKIRKEKIIRDKKRNKISRKKARLSIEKPMEEIKPLNKKQIKRQKRLAQIYKQLDQTEIGKTPFDQRRKKIKIADDNKANEVNTNNNMMKD
jgi:hypothetical protein